MINVKETAQEIIKLMLESDYVNLTFEKKSGKAVLTKQIIAKIKEAETLSKSKSPVKSTRNNMVIIDPRTKGKRSQTHDNKNYHVMTPAESSKGDKNSPM